MNEGPQIVEKIYKYRINTETVAELVDVLGEFEHGINPAKVIDIDVSAGWATIREAVKP